MQRNKRKHRVDGTAASNAPKTSVSGSVSAATVAPSQSFVHSLTAHHLRLRGTRNRHSWVFFMSEMGFVLVRHSAVEHRKVNKERVPKGLACVGEVVGKIGEVDEREHALVVSVKCGKE